MMVILDDRHGHSLLVFEPLRDLEDLVTCEARDAVR
jgi:hypothetical protein